MSNRSRFGRRKTDWIIPGLLLFSLLLAVYWGVYNYIQEQNEEAMSRMTRTQVELLNRMIERRQNPSHKLAQSKDSTARTPRSPGEK